MFFAKKRKNQGTGGIPSVPYMKIPKSYLAPRYDDPVIDLPSLYYTDPETGKDVLIADGSQSDPNGRKLISGLLDVNPKNGKFILKPEDNGDIPFYAEAGISLTPDSVRKVRKYTKTDANDGMRTPSPVQYLFPGVELREGKQSGTLMLPESISDQTSQIMIASQDQRPDESPRMYFRSKNSDYAFGPEDMRFINQASAYEGWSDGRFSGESPIIRDLDYGLVHDKKRALRYIGAMALPFLVTAGIGATSGFHDIADVLHKNYVHSPLGWASLGSLASAASLNELYDIRGKKKYIAEKERRKKEGGRVVVYDPSFGGQTTAVKGV